LITPDVMALRDQFHLPGMRILQFAFGDSDAEANLFLPHHYIANTVAYTGTHDNDTSLGWWNTAQPGERAFAQKYLGCDGHEINWDMINALSASVANTVIYPLQDVLGLSGEHRMNYPGRPDGNWEWRFSWDMIKPAHTHKLAEITSTCQRVPHPLQHTEI
jgi:4-alpha-glucanotransferase